MMNLGEEIAAAYLEKIKGCNFIQKNLYTPDVQGEIDVVGINLEKNELYVCEVAVHLRSGLRYVKDRHPNTVNKLIDKFDKDIQYAEKYFPNYEKHFMLWSPIVKSAGDEAKENQIKNVQTVKETLLERHNIALDAVINERFQECLHEMRDFAKQQTEELISPVLRMMQIEERLKEHVERLNN